MSINEDLSQGEGESFWEVNYYKKTVKRQEDGAKLCTDLMELIQTRANLEKEYAKSLKSWANKWRDNIEKGGEYNTTKAAWKGCCEEAEKIAEIHLNIKHSLMNDVYSQIKSWKSENYHKPMVGPHKETKHLEDEFKKAQKPWQKRFTKVQKTKKDYHTACKLEKTANVQENNARADSGISADQMKKIQDKSSKCRKDVESTRNKYEDALHELNASNAKYMEDMSEVFDKSQDMEAKRLQFFKEMLFGVHKCCDISNVPEVSAVYNQLHHTVGQADHQKDLKWWSLNHGKDMSMQWPQFEEYSPELHDITNKKKKEEVAGSGITLRRINTDKYHQEFNEYSPEFNHISRKEKKNHDPEVRLTAISQQQPQPATPPSPNNSYQGSNHNDTPPNSQPQTLNSAPTQNPFGDDDFGEQYDPSGGAANNNDEEGVPVKAIYDYEGQEADELSFKVGDIFNKLEDEDEQGWCRGKKDGVIGLYPNNYVTVLQ